MIQEIENSMTPQGTVSLIGFGRLGLRIGINLIQIHRGGPKTIKVIDGQKISPSDIIFYLYGGKDGEYKTDLLKRLCTHDENYRNVESITEDINDNNIDLINADVVSVQIAGGDTIKTSAKIIKKAQENGAKTIGTAGVFGTEEVTVKDISQFNDENPIVNLLREEGVTENHTIITSNKFIRDNTPIVPYTLDNIANKMTTEILKGLGQREKFEGI